MGEKMFAEKNLTMLTDFYEITMANGYLELGMQDEIAYFDMFFRKVPDGGGFAIMAGVEQVIEYLKSLKFEEEDIEYLRGRKFFSEAFLDYLKNFKFTCDVWAVPEGTPIYPHEPIITVRGPIMQAQFVESMILLIVNHQSLIATKASLLSSSMSSGMTALRLGKTPSLRPQIKTVGNSIPLAVCTVMRRTLSAFSSLSMLVKSAIFARKSARVVSGSKEASATALLNSAALSSLSWSPCRRR